MSTLTFTISSAAGSTRLSTAIVSEESRMETNSDLMRVEQNDASARGEADGAPTGISQGGFGGLFGGTFDFDDQHTSDKTHGRPEEEH